MADILIRGMEMPKSCVECLFNDDENTFCRALSKYVPAFGEPPAKCPLVPLPEKHGRLIDADALIAKYTDEINKLEGFAKGNKIAGNLDAYRACHIRAAYLSEARINIEAAPTIIEAEGLTE